MPTYLDIGAVRIQQWLGRTRSLKARRGASWALREQTSRATVEAVLPPGAHINADAGDVDGVVSLQLDSDTDARRVTTLVLTHLRHHLPGLEFEAIRTDAVSYLDARATLAQRRATGDVLTWLPAASEFPLARLCAECGVAPAVTERTVDDGPAGVCADCAVRIDHAGSARSTRAVPGPEQDLVEDLNRWVPGRRMPHFADEFDDLARVAADQRGLSGTHLATVFVDGNRLGAFVQAARRSGEDVAIVIDEATRQALAEATARITRDSDALMPVIPHLAGGDDVLVSVVADRAWDFTRELLHRFGSLLVEPSHRWQVTPPTASAGVVFARANYPFHRCVELAHDALRRAKTHFAGTEAAVCWADITAEGQLPVDRTPVSLGLLDSRWDRLASLREIPQSARFRLARAAGDPTEARRQVTRLGLHQAEPFLTDGELPLATALSIVRWLR